jgi:hypothetical protein
MPRILVYQMFFKPAVIVPPVAAVAGTRFIRMNVVYNDTLYLNVGIPDSL